jgi:ATP-dependent exoDNAse (exonuclease V) beta subunit
VEEERRLFYVAITRARDMLYVYFPLRYYRRPRGRDDAHAYAQLTRFLSDRVRAHFDEETTGASAQPDGPDWSADGSTRDVDRFLASLWDG